MKKIISLLLCLCMIIGMIPGVVAAEQQNYLVLGDSISTDMRLNEGEKSFTQILAEENGYTLNSQSEEDMTAAGLYEILATGALDQAIANADLITITCGSNDLQALIFGTLAETYNQTHNDKIEPEEVEGILSNSSDYRYWDMLIVVMQVLQGDQASGIVPITQSEEFYQEIDRIIHNVLQVTGYILEKNPHVAIIIPTQYNPYQHFNGLYQLLDTTMDDTVQTLNAAILANAENGGYLVADVYTTFQASEEILCNATMSPLDMDFHANAAGHSLMAQVIQSVIDTLPEEIVHAYTAVVTAPTCTEAGYTTYTCACGDSYIADEVAAIGHNMGEWETTKAPACTAEGEQKRTCSVCGYAETKKLDATGHDYKSVVTAPTCTEAGYTTYTCACGDTYTADEVAALGHAWNAGEVTKEPTEQEEGVKTYTCTVCGDTKTESLPKLNHVHHYEATVTAPTCTEKGYTTYLCTCGDSYVADEVAALGHDMGEWETTKAPTCVVDGEEKRTCSRCDHAETQKVNAIGHEYEIVVVAPTCTEEGYTVYTCACGDSYTGSKVDALGHDHKAVVTAPTCTEAGYTTYTCACGDSYVADEVAALGHDMGAWETIKAPACTAEGEEQRTCTRCDHAETRKVDAIAHTYEAVVTAPTCTEDGYTTYTCACGDTYTADETAALGHDWEGLDCTRCDAVRVNPFVDVALSEYYFEPVMWAVENGITVGVSADRFAPEEGCTRAQIVTFLWRAAGKPVPQTSENPFKDVFPTDYYYDAVLWAVENGITVGVKVDAFGPEEVCTRAQVATFLWRFAGEPAPAGTAEPFVDVAEDTYYAQAVLWAVEQEITYGTGHGRFEPEATCTRAQIVSFLYRAMANK